MRYRPNPKVLIAQMAAITLSRAAGGHRTPSRIEQGRVDRPGGSPARTGTEEQEPREISPADIAYRDAALSGWRPREGEARNDPLNPTTSWRVVRLPRRGDSHQGRPARRRQRPVEASAGPQGAASNSARYARCSASGVSGPRFPRSPSSPFRSVPPGVSKPPVDA